MVFIMIHTTVSKHIGQLRAAGHDGLCPIASQALNISLNHMHAGLTVSNEASSDNKTFLDKIIELIINSYRIFKIAIKKAIRDYMHGFSKKYTEWEMDNVSFGDTDPVEIDVTNPFLFRGKDCLLKSGSIYIKNDLVAGGNYRKFQFVNGVSSLTGAGNVLIEQLKNDDPIDAGVIFKDLFDELRELSQPYPKDNYGNWGFDNYNKGMGDDLEELKRLTFQAGGGEPGSYTLVVDNPKDCISSIKLIKEQLKTVEKIISDYTYFDTLETRLVTAKQTFTSMAGNEDSDRFKEALDILNFTYEMFNKYSTLNLKFALSLAKSLTAAGDVYHNAYVKFRQQNK